MNSDLTQRATRLASTLLGATTPSDVEYVEQALVLSRWVHGATATITYDSVADALQVEFGGPEEVRETAGADAIHDQPVTGDVDLAYSCIGIAGFVRVTAACLTHAARNLETGRAQQFYEIVGKDVWLQSVRMVTDALPGPTVVRLASDSADDLLERWTLARAARAESTGNGHRASGLTPERLRAELGQWSAELVEIRDPADLVVAARSGFTAGQADTIIKVPTLLGWLTHYWSSDPPTDAIVRIAQSNDEVGRAHVRLLELAGQVIRVSSRSPHALAASTPNRPEILVDNDSLERDGTVVVRRMYHDQGVMDIVIESDHIIAEETFPVVALLSMREGEAPGTQLLFLLIPAGPGTSAGSHAESRLLMDPAMTSDKLLLYRSPIEASRLIGRNLEAVSRSVAVAKLPWKDAWRRAALATPPGHPLRDAVINGLSAQG